MSTSTSEPEPVLSRQLEYAVVARLIAAKANDPYGAPLWWQLAHTADACQLVAAEPPTMAAAPPVRRALCAALDLADLLPWPLPPQVRVSAAVARLVLCDATGRLLAALASPGVADVETLAEAIGDVIGALLPYALGCRRPASSFGHLSPANARSPAAGPAMTRPRARGRGPPSRRPFPA